MSLKRDGLVVSCEHCEYQKSDGTGNFEVTVPLSDSDSGVRGIAKLRCTVFSSHHEVKLKQWQHDGLQHIELAQEVQRRLSMALDFVAEKKICGNRNLCPSEVVRIVEKKSQG